MLPQPSKRDYLRVSGWVLAVVLFLFLMATCARGQTSNQIRLGPGAGNLYVELQDPDGGTTWRDSGELSASIEFLIQPRESGSSSILIPVTYASGSFGGGGAYWRKGLGDSKPRNGGKVHSWYLGLGAAATFLAADSYPVKELTVALGPALLVEAPMPIGENFFVGVRVAWQPRIFGDEVLESVMPIGIVLPADF